MGKRGFSNKIKVRLGDAITGIINVID